MIALWQPVIPARSPSGRNSTARPWPTLPGGWTRPGCQRERYQICVRGRLAQTTHIRHLYAKFGTHHRAEAVDLARALGLLAPARTSPASR